MFKLASIFLVFFASTYSVAGESIKSIYTGLILKNGYTRILTFRDEELVAEFDVGDIVERCDDKNYFCISSFEFTLVLPKNGLEKGKEWSFNNIQFKHEEDSIIWFLDKQIKVHYITSSQGVNFLFSDEFGLVAYVSSRWEEQLTMLLSNLNGIGKDWYKRDRLDSKTQNG